MGIGDGCCVAFHSMPSPENAMYINAVEWPGTYRFPIVDLDVAGSDPVTRPKLFRALSESRKSRTTVEPDKRMTSRAGSHEHWRRHEDAMKRAAERQPRTRERAARHKAKLKAKRRRQRARAQK